MKTNSPRLIWMLIACALVISTRDALAMGYDFPNDKPITGTNWPKGMEKLVNATNRVHGFSLNFTDTFFFSGSASELTAFLQNYSRIEGIESRRLILHDGLGEAKSPWGKTGRLCDWEFNVCLKGWHNAAMLLRQGTNSVEVIQKAGKEPGYILTVNFWTGSRVKLEQVDIPKNVEVEKGK